MQEALVFSFAVGALLRLAVMTATGHLSTQALILALEAVPVTLLVTALSATRAPPVSQEAVKKIVCVLLIASGAAMLR